jgi:6-phosphogluconolactonase/glucosamine-6-phosphate isomerase/deaminase
VPEPIDNHEAQEYKIIEKIKKANECNAHPGQVHIVVSGGEHITPTHEDLAIWAHLVVSNPFFSFFTV